MAALALLAEVLTMYGLLGTDSPRQRGEVLQRTRLDGGGGMLQAAPPPSRLDGQGWRPPSRLPSKPALEYTKDIITVALLLLALPWLVHKLATKPGQLLPALGRSHVSPPSPRTPGVP